MACHKFLGEVETEKEQRWQPQYGAGLHAEHRCRERLLLKKKEIQIAGACVRGVRTAQEEGKGMLSLLLCHHEGEGKGEGGHP